MGLIRIRPGRRLTASRVVPDYWEPKKGMKMYSVGCSHGQDATAWDTRILDPKVAMNTGNNQSFFEMKCANQPMEGRSGGGLYTTDGYVAGVCDFADPAEKVGLYATPTAIHRLLDRAQLTTLYKAPAQGPGAMLAATGRSQTKVRGSIPRLRRLCHRRRPIIHHPRSRDVPNRRSGNQGRIELGAGEVVADLGRR